MAQPVVLDGVVFAMDSDAVVSAFSLADGKRLWRVDTKPQDLDSTNVGGGLGADGGTCTPTTAWSSLIALDVGQRKGEMADGPRRASAFGPDDRRRAGVRHHHR